MTPLGLRRLGGGARLLARLLGTMACALVLAAPASAGDTPRLMARDLPGDAPAVAGRDSPATGPREILVMLRLPAPHFRPDVYYPADYRDDAGSAARRRIAEALAREYGLTILEDWAMPALNVDCYRMTAPAGVDPAKLISALERDKRVSWAQQVNTFAGQGAGAGDPLYPVQPAAGQWQLSDIRKTATGRKVMVAVIDSGVEVDHPDLAGQVAVKQNFVDGVPYAGERHGTGVAGVIAARAGNGVGIEGVAPDARIMALRGCWEEAGGATRCNSFTLGKAMNFALMNGAQIINLSLTGPPDRLLSELIDLACARGVRVVSAVDPGRRDGGFPASHPGVFAVTMDQARPAEGKILSAPGRDIPTSAPGARWGMVSGSSYSAAHISGMMAVLSELRPGLTLAQVRSSLVHQHAASGIDFCATVTRITGKCTCVCTAPDRTSHAINR